MAKVPHFWITEALADQFIEWLQNEPEITSQEPMRGEFTPERCRMLFRDQNLGFEQTFMLYDSPKYRCVNVPRNVLRALATYCELTGTPQPAGTLGSARGDGKDDASVAAARAAAKKTESKPDPEPAKPTKTKKTKKS